MTAVPAESKPAPKKRAGRKSDVPKFHEWMSLQHLNTDPVRADAARHIQTRWGYTEYYSHDRVIRVLDREDSPHVVGAKLLADDYAEQFGLEPADRQRIAGIASPWFPIAPALCSRPGCQRRAHPGNEVCVRHSAVVLTDADRAEVSRVVADRLIDLSERAVRVIEDLLDHGKSEKVRLDAAIAVLDRTGVGPTSTLRLEGSGDEPPESPAAIIAGRLERLSQSAAAEIGSRPNLEVIVTDAELVEDDRSD